MKKVNFKILLVFFILTFASGETNNEVKTTFFEGKFQYFVENGKAIISGYDRYGGDVHVVIPEKLGEYDVVSIDNGAFWQRERVITIEIPNFVTNIEYGAFSGCENLTDIILSGDNPIYSFTEGVLFDKKQNTLHTYLATNNEKSYVIPDFVTSIGDNAFYGCESLATIEIPSSVRNIGAQAFLDCENLTTITLTDDNPVYSFIDGVLFDTNENMLHTYLASNKKTSYIIPDFVKNIADGAFSNCDNLITVEIPDSVISIGNRAFSNCANLTTIEIPDSVESIGYGAFQFCGRLTTIKLSDSIRTIENSTFSFCHSLKAIEIPDSVKSIGSFAFAGCRSLKTIKIPDSVKSIEDRAFVSCEGLTTLEISNSLISIGEGLFFGCESLTSLEIPDSVISIGENAFSNCANLTTLKIPNSVTSIGTWAFKDCNNLTLTIDDDSSYAYKYAVANKIDYVLINESPSGGQKKPLQSVDDAIIWVDAMFENSVREMLNKQNGLIMKNDLNSITKLDFNRNMMLTQIDDIVHFKNLTALSLSWNDTIDLSPLSNLSNLTELRLSNNELTNISPLANLTTLTSLDLKSNEISDISALASLIALTKLNLEMNDITYLSPLSSLTNLTELDLSYNKISDLSPLSSLTNLTHLDLTRTQISDLTGLSSLTNLIDLDLSYNKISDLSPLSSLTDLTTVDFYENEISDINPLSNLTNLTDLRLGYNKISDLSPLSGLTNLTYLRVNNNEISDLSPLSGLANLTNLAISNNSFKNLNALSALPNLVGLDLNIMELNALYIYEEDEHVLNGMWREQYYYDYLTSNPISYADYDAGQGKTAYAIEIDIGTDGTGYYWNVNPFGIARVEQPTDNEFILYIVTSYEGDIMPVGEVFITRIDENSIFISHGEGLSLDGREGDPPFFRVTSRAKIPPQNGVINDTRVRLRTKPNLESDTWGYFNTGDEVLIVDKSAEKQQIGEMEDYWYKVQTEKFPDGWVYGAFIDIDVTN